MSGYTAVAQSPPSPFAAAAPAAAASAAVPIILDLSSAAALRSTVARLFPPAAAAAPADTAAHNSTPTADSAAPMSNPPSSSPSSMLGVEASELAGFVARVRGRRWIQTFRPLNSFIGQTQFSKPRTTAEAMARLENNLPFFLTNYLAICGLVVLITILSQPSLILVGVFLAALWAASMRVDEVRLPGQIVLAGRNKMITLTSISGIVLFIFAGTTIFFLVGICATIVLVHALIHTLPPLDDSAGDEMSEFIGADEREAAGTQV